MLLFKDDFHGPSDFSDSVTDESLMERFPFVNRIHPDVLPRGLRWSSRPLAELDLSDRKMSPIGQEPL